MFFFGLWVVWDPHIFFILTPYEIWIYKCFLQLWRLTLHLLIISFAGQRFLVSCNSTCWLLLVFYTKIHCHTNSKEVFPMFSSWSFMVSALTFKSNPFWVNFCTWCNKVVQFDSFAYSCPVWGFPYCIASLYLPFLYIIYQSLWVYFKLKYYVIQSSFPTSLWAPWG